MMKTAVLLATYNGEKFLSQQLDSIRLQELPPDYVIFRDDGSTDGTIAFLKAYIAEHKLENWLIKQNETNLGWRLNFRQLLLDAQELGIDVVFFSDQDDKWTLDKNKKQLELLEKNPQIEVLTGDIEVQVLSSDATVPKYFEFADKDREFSAFLPRYTFDSYRSGWTHAVRKSFYEAILTYWQPHYGMAHDALFDTLSSLTGTGYNLNKIVGTHFRHGGNASGSGYLSVRDPKEAYFKLLLNYLGFYDIIYHVLKERGSRYTEELAGYYFFYQRLYELAKEGGKVSLLEHIISQRRYYKGTHGLVRDLIFLFKK